jgi:hypothetical protein
MTTMNTAQRILAKWPLFTDHLPPSGKHHLAKWDKKAKKRKNRGQR